MAAVAVAYRAWNQELGVATVSRFLWFPVRLALSYGGYSGSQWRGRCSILGSRNRGPFSVMASDGSTWVHGWAMVVRFG